MKSDAVVIGAGVVGLSIASRLAASGISIIILEKEGLFGSGTSSRNSEVIHAGIHYNKNSLKSIGCIEGNQMLYSWCKAFDVQHQKCGKLIVAMNSEQEKGLMGVKQNAEACGVSTLKLIDSNELKSLEPSVNALSALFSPTTGIIDSFGLMESLITQAMESTSDFNISYHTAVKTIREASNGNFWSLQCETNSGKTSENFEITTPLVFNAAGLSALELMKDVSTFEMNKYILHPCRGRYFSLRKKLTHPLKHLVYPLPEKNHTGLGIHATLDLSGSVRFGPDTEYISDSNDYRFVNPQKEVQKMFAKSIQEYLPEVQFDHLEEAYTGIRPKLSGPGEPPFDFQILETQGTSPGMRNKRLFTLAGIESPGLTSCLWLAHYVGNRLKITPKGWWEQFKDNNS